ncbi:bifunctional 4-hydroxy-2-oxoglutarate aldolase/2-dehydro-3-deoxy-phosphogluconate aldolase [Kineococcus rhizosphaerae]|uniref:2-dehydro-3-deoxy-phosphogluconate aldolase n=1 Tax=Kineococcus rhizosphaerae TaxID=559628 RepID=A0A2T0QYB0_9ACTN|nr:bifunctional 4-hydroxy-2-oxoglutarate aldolase/2-dehydro-3-deoxy-phosphogluconate aldolase [Kineococcus rhizosphaerae]PRY11164.1 2-keto-3-deoxy-phosphogluconate aldolase [Kineococcus rhizosphaerae]
MVPSVLDVSPVIPVVVLEDAADAVPLARALLAGGIGIVELTLRTASALDAVRAVATEVPEILLGVGTVVSAEDVARAVDAGAQFLVSPGTTRSIVEAARDRDVPLLPGVATVSEALAALELGLHELKFFPAEQAGGAAFLGALRSPLPQLRFCPTGGVTPANAPQYLALPNVGCVGGSWITAPDVLADHDFGRVEELARAAVALR